MTHARAPGDRPRILHILDPEIAGDAMTAAASLVAGVPGYTYRSWVIGTSAAEAALADTPLRTTDRVPIPAGSSTLAARAMARLALDRAAPDAVCAWSLRAVDVVRRVYDYRTPLIAISADPPPDVPLPPALARALQGVRVIAIGKTTWSRWNRVRDIDSRLAPLPSWVGPSASSRGARRETVRAELGLTEADLGVLLLADTPSRCDAVRFAFLTGVQFVAGQPVAAIIPAGCPGARRAARFVRAHARRWKLVISPHPLRDALCAADLAVSVPDPRQDRPRPHAASPATIRLAMSLGVPVVSVPGDYATEALGELSNVCVAPRPLDRAIAARMVALADDRASLAEASAAAQRIAGRESGAFERAVAEVLHEAVSPFMIQPGLPPPRVLAEARL